MHVDAASVNVSGRRFPAMIYVPEKPTKFCWICGKDISLEVSKIDEHGLFVHATCHEKRMLLKAASTQLELRKQNQPNRAA
jgi:hypothetical protein